MNQITRIIDHSLYPRKVIADTRQAYRDYCTLKVTPLSGDRAEVIIAVRGEYEAEARRIFMELLNYALDKAAESSFESA